MTTVIVHEPLAASHRLYRHHPHISNVGGELWLSWSLQRTGEDGPGQYVIGARSLDGGQTWQDYVELFPRCDNENQSRTNNGRVLTGGEFVEVGGKVFATTHPYITAGYNAAGRVRNGYDALAREVTGWALGDLFWVDSAQWSPLTGYPTWSLGSTADRQLLKDYWADEANKPTWGWGQNTPHCELYDATGLRTFTEPTTATVGGNVVRLWRGIESPSRVWRGLSASLSETVLANDPSRLFLIEFETGKLAAIGNFLNGKQRDPLTIMVSEDFGVSWRFGIDVVAGVGNNPTFKSEANDGRAGGDQYPSACIHGDQLVIACSRHKESIVVHHVPLSAL